MKNLNVLIVFVLFNMVSISLISEGKTKKKNFNEFPKTSKVASKSSITIVKAYLEIKNALVKDDRAVAAAAGAKLASAAARYEFTSYSDVQKKELTEILEVVGEHGEHIAKSDIGHQREHMAALGVEIKDLIKLTGIDQTLYQQFCPMYNNSEGAMWLSSSNEIQNPFFGSKMPKCGSVTEIIQAK